jgi:hypothetical protein
MHAPSGGEAVLQGAASQTTPYCDVAGDAQRGRGGILPFLGAHCQRDPETYKKTIKELEECEDEELPTPYLHYVKEDMVTDSVRQRRSGGWRAGLWAFSN